MQNQSEHIQLSCAYALKLSKEGEQERTSVKKRFFLKYLENSHGMITAACNKTEISRATLYRWRDDDPEFKTALLEILHARGDVLEDRMFAKAMEGDVSALKFLLTRLNSRYQPQSEPDRQVHIYHHVGVRPESQLPITIEDIIDNPDLWDSYMEWQEKREKKK